MTTFINTRHYRASHNREPRGRGRWIFSATDPFTFNYDDPLEIFNGTYSEARKQAIRWAKAQGFTTLHVCA